MIAEEFILDASVAAKWVLPPADEPLITEALWLRNLNDNGRIQLHVPDLFWPEIGNVLWKNVRKNRITSPQALEALDILRTKGLMSIPTEKLMAKALDYACTFNRSAYDCTYLALAVTSGLPLLTADEKLVNAVGRYFPIRWLGSAW